VTDLLFMIIYFDPIIFPGGFLVPALPGKGRENRRC
jgi:hypothetical protein